MQSGWRFRAGIIVFVVSFLSPALIPLVAASGLSTELKATISGLLAIGIPELGAFIAVAVMGKPGYHEMKRRLYAFFKKYGPPEEVSLVRYRIGLIMLAGPILFASASGNAPPKSADPCCALRRSRAGSKRASFD